MYCARCRSVVGEADTLCSKCQREHTPETRVECPVPGPSRPCGRRQESIHKFRVLYWQEYGEVIPEVEAIEMFEDFLELYKIVYKFPGYDDPRPALTGRKRTVRRKKSNPDG